MTKIPAGEEDTATGCVGCMVVVAVVVAVLWTAVLIARLS